MIVLFHHLPPTAIMTPPKCATHTLHDVFTGQEYTVKDPNSNEGESIDQGRRMYFATMGGRRYEWISANCEVSDTLPEEM